MKGVGICIKCGIEKKYYRNNTCSRCYMRNFEKLKNIEVNNRCPKCNKLIGYRSTYCLSCFQEGEKSHKWKGGTYNKGGYILVLEKSHPRANKDGYVRRSLLMAEKKLGRSLTKKEVVHHKNKITNDDRLENLRVFEDNKQHISYHAKMRCKDDKGRFRNTM